MKGGPKQRGGRASARRATRNRIVDALVQLHEELGPRNATISAIAERAGVQRLTVYRHFPSDTELFKACTGRWLELNPPPDPRTWSVALDAIARCRAALGSLYGYYRNTERMWEVSFRDESEVPALQTPMADFRAYLRQIANDLVHALGPESRRDVAVTVGHAVEFQTWQSLSRQGLEDAQAADLVTTWIRAANAISRKRSGSAADPSVAVSEATVVIRDGAGNTVLQGAAKLLPPTDD